MNLIDLVFPKTCLECGLSGDYICLDCLSKVGLAQPICPYCKRASINGITHPRCKKTFGLDGFVSIWEYEGVIRKAILALKYKYATEITSLLNRFITKKLTTPNSGYLFPDSITLIPIPLHWHRQNVRGFNQSVEVGKSISEAMDWKFLPNLLNKNQQTISQAELSGDARRKNLKGVFAIVPHGSLFTLPDSVVLFDDVLTTGSTLHEAAKVLKRAGVQKVWGLTIAR